LGAVEAYAEMWLYFESGKVSATPGDEVYDVLQMAIFEPIKGGRYDN
jgi:hypothetical protein